MRNARRLALPCLALLALVASARGARAQTYIWTDERGVVHAASEPSEVPEKYRAKSVRDAQRPRSNVTVLAPDEPAAPAESDAPNAEAPMKPGKKPEHLPPPKAATPAPAPTEGAPPPQAAASGDETPKPKGLPAPAEGFEWSCTADPDGGKPKCEQFEKRSSKRQRHAAARAEARKQMGVDPDEENDPDVKAEMQRRADKEYEKTTTKPPAPARSNDGDDSDSGGDSDD